MGTTHSARRQSGARSAVARTSAAPGLDGLPTESIERVLDFLQLRDIAAANATARFFRGASGGCSPVEHALRRRARARGHARALPAVLPPSACTWTELLLEFEAVHSLASVHTSPIACGGNFSAFVDAEGGLHTCGEEEVLDEDELPLDELAAPSALGHADSPAVVVPTRVASLDAVRVRSVAASRIHLLALSEAGAVYGCGENCDGQLGLGDTATRRTFESIRGLEPELVVCIAAGVEHSLALTAAGCAYSWGDNDAGQLGHGDTEQRWEPTRIEALDGVRVGGISGGGWHTLLLSTAGSVYSCGVGICGQLGHGDEQEQLLTPRRIEALAGVRALHVSAGYVHSLVVDAAGSVHSFGWGDGGPLGHGDEATQLVPKRVEALAGVRAVRACAGYWISAVLGADSSVHTFGDNKHGQLGTGRAEEAKRAPTRVPALVHARVVRCAMGNWHSLFETADGDVYACGEQGGALGLGLGSVAVGDEPSHVATPALAGSLRTAFR